MSRIDKKELKNVVECLLFISENPISLKKISEITGEKDQNKLLSAVKELKKEYEARKGGIQISEIAGGYQFYTKKEYGEWIKKLYENKVTYQLSLPAVETLSIIAYKQPITKLEIEKIRGVDTSGIIRGLLDKKLIKIAGRKECVGSPLIYRTTDNFLRYFGLKDISEMPDIDNQ